MVLNNDAPHSFSKNELNDLVHYLNLSKSSPNQPTRWPKKAQKSHFRPIFTISYYAMIPLVWPTRDQTGPHVPWKSKQNEFDTPALDNDDGCFSYLCHAFPGLIIEKLKAGIFDGPQICQFIREPEFENSLNDVELEARKFLLWSWRTFLAITRPGTMQNLSQICWLLSKTLDAT